MGEPQPICCNRCNMPIGYYVVINWSGPEYRCLTCKFDTSKQPKTDGVK